MTNDRGNNKSGSQLDPNQVDSVEGGIIAMLFRKILLDLNLTQQISFLAREAEKATNKLDSEVNKVKSRTQFINQATSKSMTFKIFVRLLRFLVGVTKIRLTIELERANGKRSTHSTHFFNIGSIEPEDLGEKKLDKLEESLKKNENMTKEVGNEK